MNEFLQEIIRKEETDYEQLSRNARQKVEQCYAESVVAKKYMELYRKLLMV